MNYVSSFLIRLPARGKLSKRKNKWNAIETMQFTLCADEENSTKKARGSYWTRLCFKFMKRKIIKSNYLHSQRSLSGKKIDSLDQKKRTTSLSVVSHVLRCFTHLQTTLECNGAFRCHKIALNSYNKLHGSTLYRGRCPLLESPTRKGSPAASRILLITIKA